jgi:hypothetical protein
MPARDVSGRRRRWVVVKRRSLLDVAGGDAGGEKEYSDQAHGTDPSVGVVI